MRNKIAVALFTGFLFIGGLITVLNSSEAISAECRTIGYEGVSDVIESSLTDGVFLKHQWINLNGLVHRLLGQTVIEDEEVDVYKLDNAKLSYVDNSIPKQKLVKYAENIAEFKAGISTDVPLIYVQIPFKINSEENPLPPGIRDYSNENADALLEALKDNNVDCLDLRAADRFADKTNSAFFKTDQHWKPEAALAAASEINYHMMKEYGWDYSAEKYEIGEYRQVRYSESFLGSFGKKSGAWYSGVEDFVLLTPKSDAKYSFTAETANGPIEKKGSFEDSLLVKKYLEGNIYETNLYEIYTGGNYKLCRVCNNCGEEKKLLLIRDSFSCTLIPFLTEMSNDITAIDLRYADPDTLSDCLNRDYDAIIIAYNPSVFGERAFTFK